MHHVPPRLIDLDGGGSLRLDCQTIFPLAGCSYRWLATGTVARLTGGSRAGIRGGFIGGRLKKKIWLTSLVGSCAAFLGVNDTCTCRARIDSFRIQMNTRKWEVLTSILVPSMTVRIQGAVGFARVGLGLRLWSPLKSFSR